MALYAVWQLPEVWLWRCEHCLDKVKFGGKNTEFCEAPDVNDGKKEVKIEEPNPVDVKVYMCKHCDATYTKNGSLYAHVRNKHKLTNV